MKLKLKWQRYLLPGLVSLTLAACNLPSTAGIPTPDLDLVVASTQTAIAIQTLISPENLATTTFPAETPTGAPGAEATALSTPTLTPTQTPTSLPATPTQQTNCSDRAAFVSETIPDGTIVKPAEQIQKIWRLRNAGDCTWSTGYTLVFKDGSQMGASSPQALQASVEPGETLEVKVDLVAPASAGTYRSEWMLANAAGQEFGLGQNGTRRFWAEIEVTDSGASLDLGTPDWQDSFEANLGYWYLTADDNIEFAIDDGVLRMTAFHPGGDNWRVAELRELGDFYIQARVTFGESCTGKDSFGFLLRAPNSAGSTINSGYAFAFACDGNFRYYLMNDGEYVGLQNWKSTSNLNAGADQSNQVGVWAEGDTFRIYINGERVRRIHR